MELVYLMVKGKNGLWHTLASVTTNGEVLLYWAGILCLVVLVAHTIMAYGRRRPWWNRFVSFQQLHSLGATLFLLAAAMHWWPFALFLIPAVSVHGISVARRWYYYNNHHPNNNNHDVRPCRPVKAPALLLGSCLMTSLVAVTVVWMGRETYMTSKQANLYIPFVFPPLAVAVGLVASIVTSWVILMWTEDPTTNQQQTNNHNHRTAIAVTTTTTESDLTSPLLLPVSSLTYAATGGGGGETLVNHCVDAENGILEMEPAMEPVSPRGLS